MATGMSEYEQQRLRNLEENRRILNSIRQEQLYSFESVKPKKKKVKHTDENAKENPPKPSKKKTQVEKVAENVTGDEESMDIEEDIGSGRRKSARLQGKSPAYSWKDADEGGDNSDDEDFIVRKQNRSAPKGPRPKIVVPKNRPNFYGAVPGVEIGRVWETRLACCADGVHRPTVAGIHAGPEGAYSVSLAGGYEDDIDLGDCFTYTGEGGRELKGTKSNPKNLRTAPQSKDQALTRGNLALSLNITTRRPVRVIRGANLKNEFAPEYGYRYDGLYTVEKYWSCTGISGFMVYKFAFRRCPDQAPPPWVYMPPQNSASSTEEEEDEEAEEKPTVLKVKLFNK